MEGIWGGDGKVDWETPIDLKEYIAFVKLLQQRGISPILSDLMAEFKEIRKKVEDKTRNLAYKLLQVSAYGAMGVKVGEEREYYRSRWKGGATFYNAG